MSAKAVAKLPPIPTKRSHSANEGATKIGPQSPQYQGLQGPSYQLTLKGDSTKHNLPQPSTLKPFVDTKSGSLDSWPAHCTSQAAAKLAVPTHHPLSKSNQTQLKPMDSEGEPYQSKVPKPKFLEQLEMFLRKELRNAGSDDGPSETRLQAFREVFEYLIEDFKTYKPLLSAIKNEYEIMLSHQREQIRELEPLKAMLVTVSEQCNQKIMAFREEERQEMTDLKQEKLELLEKIDAMKEEHQSLQMQIGKLQDEVALEYQKYRDECDARKLLVSDINDMRYQQEDFQKSQANQQQSEEEKEDPVKLKIALKKCREDLSEATQRLNEMIANYGDVVPRRDFEFLKADFEKIQKQKDDLQTDHETLQKEHEILQETAAKLQEERDKYLEEWETLKGRATPRPDWDRCAKVLEGGEERWNMISQGKRSDQLVELLLKEIMGDGEGYEYLEQKGTGEDVPVYLRYEGKIRKRKMEKRDVGIIFKEMWAEKGKKDAEKTDGSLESVDTFFLQFMQQKYGEQRAAFEWTYNLVEICEQNEEDDHLKMFYSILTGELDERVYHQFMERLANLFESLEKKDEESGSEGKLTKETFEEVLREYFPIKDDESIEALMTAVTEELTLQETEKIDYKELFTEDEDGSTGPFINKLRVQDREERIYYVEEIRKELGEKGDVPVPELRMAIAVIDAEIDKANIMFYLTVAYDTEVDKLNQAAPVSLDLICERLQKGPVRRIGKLNSSELE